MWGQFLANIAPESSCMSCCVAQLLCLVRLIRTFVESVAGEACGNTSGPVLTPENVVTLTGPVAEVGAQLVGHVQHNVLSSSNVVEVGQFLFFNNQTL